MKLSKITYFKIIVCVLNLLKFVKRIIIYIIK